MNQRVTRFTGFPVNLFCELKRGDGLALAAMLAGMKRLLPLVLAFASCASTEFQNFQGSTPVQGSGGTSVWVGGVEFWTYGTPPRKYRVVGIIDDVRPGGPLGMRGLREAVAAKAKANGADAVIVLSNQSEVTGYINTGNATATYNPYTNTAYATGFGSSAAVRRNTAKFAAIKYL